MGGFSPPKSIVVVFVGVALRGHPSLHYYLSRELLTRSDHRARAGCCFRKSREEFGDGEQVAECRAKRKGVVG